MAVVIDGRDVSIDIDLQDSAVTQVDTLVPLGGQSAVLTTEWNVPGKPVELDFTKRPDDPGFMEFFDLENSRILMTLSFPEITWDGLPTLEPITVPGMTVTDATKKALNYCSRMTPNAVQCRVLRGSPIHSVCQSIQVLITGQPIWNESHPALTREIYRSIMHDKTDGGDSRLSGEDFEGDLDGLHAGSSMIVGQVMVNPGSWTVLSAALNLPKLMVSVDDLGNVTYGFEPHVGPEPIVAGRLDYMDAVLAARNEPTLWEKLDRAGIYLPNAACEKRFEISLGEFVQLYNHGYNGQYMPNGLMKFRAYRAENSAIVAYLGPNISNTESASVIVKSFDLQSRKILVRWQEYQGGRVINPDMKWHATPMYLKMYEKVIDTVSTATQQDDTYDIATLPLFGWSIVRNGAEGHVAFCCNDHITRQELNLNSTRVHSTIMVQSGNSEPSVTLSEDDLSARTMYSQFCTLTGRDEGTTVSLTRFCNNLVMRPFTLSPVGGLATLNEIKPAVASADSGNNALCVRSFRTFEPGETSCIGTHAIIAPYCADIYFDYHGRMSVIAP